MSVTHCAGRGPGAGFRSGRRIQVWAQDSGLGAGFRSRHRIQVQAQDSGPGAGFRFGSDGIRSEFGVRADLASVSGSLHQLYFHVGYLIVGGGHVAKSDSKTSGVMSGQWV